MNLQHQKEEKAGLVQLENKNRTLLRSEKFIQELYNTRKNFQLIKTKITTKRLIIFFTSNHIFCDEKHFLVPDYEYYEWINISKDINNYYSNIIFVRNVHRCWYLNGINKQINSIDKLVNFLKEIINKYCNGYEITVCGTSAGGYMATLCGIKLNADIVMNFCGQFVLNFEAYNPKYVKLSDYLKYKSIIPLIKKQSANNDKIKTQINYYFPYYSEVDYIQYLKVRNLENLNILKFDNTRHGRTVFPIYYKDILTMNKKQLNELAQIYKDKIITNYEQFNNFKENISVIKFNRKYDNP